MNNTNGHHIDRLNVQLEDMEKARFMSNADIIAMFGSIRVVLEFHSLKEDYNILNLYCNLIGHSSLSGSKLGYDSLKIIMLAIYKECKSTDLNDLIEKVNLSLNFNTLISQMMSLFKLYNLPLFILAPHNVQGFFPVLIRQLVGREIQFPQNISELITCEAKLEKRQKRAVDAYNLIKDLGTKISANDPMILTKFAFNKRENVFVLDLHFGTNRILIVPLRPYLAPT